MKIQSRRKFIHFLGAGVFALLVFVWNKLTLNHIEQNQNKKRVLPLNKNKPVSFYDDYIVLNKNGEFTVLEARCTHLGCKIHEIKNGRLVCPCHGSQFDLEGNPVKGPAFKSLQKVKVKVSIENQTIEIES